SCGCAPSARRPVMPVPSASAICSTRTSIVTRGCGSSMRTLTTEPLTRDAFAPFGQVIEQAGAHHYPINAGNCERYHDLARLEVGGVHGRPLISLLQSKHFTLPLELKMVERHP